MRVCLRPGFQSPLCVAPASILRSDSARTAEHCLATSCYSTMAEAAQELEGIRLLSLGVSILDDPGLRITGSDGSGIRGLSELLMERIKFREGREEAPLPEGLDGCGGQLTVAKLAMDAAQIYVPPAPELTGSGGFIDGLR